MKETAERNAARAASRKMAAGAALAVVEHPEDVWERVHQAGCNFFVHRHTGESTLNDPFENRALKFCDLATARPEVDPVEGTRLATGAGVYGEMRGEFEEVMKYLDKESGK